MTLETKSNRHRSQGADGKVPFWQDKTPCSFKCFFVCGKLQGSFVVSKKPANITHKESDKPTPGIHIIFLKIYCTIILLSTRRSTFSIITSLSILLLNFSIHFFSLPFRFVSQFIVLTVFDEAVVHKIFSNILLLSLCLV